MNPFFWSEIGRSLSHWGPCHSRIRRGQVSSFYGASRMRVLVDIHHPAYFHFFRNPIRLLREKGHEVRITARDKDVLSGLVESFGMKAEFFGLDSRHPVALGIELFFRQWKLLKIIRTFEPDVIVSAAGPYATLAGKLTGTPTLVYSDTEPERLEHALSFPFASEILVPNCFRKPIHRFHRRFDGYKELAYLHPDYFSPDSSVLEEMGLEPGQLFCVIRLVGWDASHDIGVRSFSPADRRTVIHSLRRHVRVVISAEGELPPDLRDCRINLDVARMHHLLAFAGLVFGNSATMCSEGAMLGVPGVYVDPLGRGYTDELERDYGLIFNYHPDQCGQALKQAVSILTDYDRQCWQNKRQRLLSDKVNVTKTVSDAILECGKHNRHHFLRS